MRMTLPCAGGPAYRHRGHVTSCSRSENGQEILATYGARRRSLPARAPMNVTKVLLDILIVLVAAKAAAELSERVHLPAVVGEIVAGVIVGPSALGLVQGDDVLRVLGELGVILLLLQV